jgi:hypothetical protein
MFGKKKTVKITEEKYKWMVEKIKERQDYKRELDVLKWNCDIAIRGLRMTPDDWKLYKEYIKHNWYSLDDQAKNTEMMVADTMAGIEREEEGYMAFAQFIKSLYDLEFYSKQEREHGEY